MKNTIKQYKKKALIFATGMREKGREGMRQRESRKKGKKD